MEYLKARPTLYNGIQMRSRLEAQFAEWMDARGWRWEYEPDCYASPDGQYLPDFRVDALGAEYFVEVKRSDEFFTGFWLAKGDIIRASRPEAHFGIVAPGGAKRWAAEWRLHTREPCSDLIEWVTGERAAVVEVESWSRVWLPEGPEVNAVLAAIHVPSALVPLLVTGEGEVSLAEVLFADEVNRDAFCAVVMAGCLDDALAAEEVGSGAKDLLRNLADKELDGEPGDAIAGLIREAARRMMQASSEPVALEILQATMDINEPKTRGSACEVLLTWLRG